MDLVRQCIHQFCLFVCLFNKAPQNSHLKQPPFYLAHDFVGYLGWRRQFHGWLGPLTMWSQIFQQISPSFTWQCVSSKKLQKGTHSQSTSTFLEHLLMFSGPKQVMWPSLDLGVEKQTPPLHERSCKVILQKDIYISMGRICRHFIPGVFSQGSICGL